MLTFNDLRRCKSFIKLNFTEKVDWERKLYFSIDTRTLKETDVFIAISGDRYNALSFLPKVIEVGCQYVVYSVNEENNRLINKYRDDIKFIATTDTTLFLQEITSCLAVDFQARGGKLIAISGSNGKTTTKEMLFHLLKSVHQETICTQKNNNNHIGVPLTLLQINEQTKFAVIELGSNHPGEIKVLCDIIQAKLGVTTNIGDTHLEFFHNRENVFKEEGYLYHSVQKQQGDKIFFVNSDDNLIKLYENQKNTLSYGKKGKDYQFFLDNNEGIIKNKNNEYKIINKFITGEHNLFNLCVGFIIAKEIDGDNTQKYLEFAQEFKPTSNRSQWLDFEQKKIFMDAYNANPSSMIMAVDGFVQKVGKNSNYCLILGDMNELGDEASQFHYNLASELEHKGYKNFIFVGDFAQDYNAGCGGKGVCYAATHMLGQDFSQKILDKYDYIFIKGSRSLQLESLVDIN